MKFSTTALPLLALFAQQAFAIALPLSDDLAVELEARHQQNSRQRQQGGRQVSRACIIHFEL